MNRKRKILIQMLDRHGAPRAWATGPEDRANDVREEARAQLQKWRSRQIDLKDAEQQFTETSDVILDDGTETP